MGNSNLTSESTPKEIIDELFPLEWCRDNMVVPLGFQLDKFSGDQFLTIAIWDFTYLGTIGEFIKFHAAKSQIKVAFTDKPADEIQALLDKASQES